MNAPLILKWRYWDASSARASRASNYLKYIGTRPGVEKNNLNDESPASKAQMELIKQIIRDKPSIKKTDEYLSFAESQTRATASILIGTALDDNPDLLEKKTYLDYIGTRPRVERVGEHGLFTDEGKEINLSEERRKLNEFNGRIHSVILSLSREDAEATGFNNADTWKQLIRANKDKLADSFQIPINNLQWFGAFHNEATHPHIHIMLYSDNKEYPGYLPQSSLTKLKSTIAKTVFKNELDLIYSEQTERRNALTKIAREKVEALVKATGSTSLEQIDLEMISLFHTLADRLSDTPGRKVYGYLPAEIKELADKITDKLCDDERIRQLYDMWYDCKYAILGKYTMHLPEKLPLSQEKAFRAIKNAIIREAVKLNEQNKTQVSEGAALRSRAPRFNALSAVDRLFASAGAIFKVSIKCQMKEHPEIVQDSKDAREEWEKENGIAHINI